MAGLIRSFLAWLSAAGIACGGGFLGSAFAQSAPSEGKPVQSADKASSAVFQAIRTLESANDPKCHATASRLQNMICGTPLTDGAQFAKNALTRTLAGRIWRDAADLHGDGRGAISATTIAKALESYPRIEKTEAGWRVQTLGDRGISITARDKRQFSSIAYSLRAILGAEQESWLDDQADLPPLTDEAVIKLKEAIDVFQLVLLELADRAARTSNQRVITADGIQEAWKLLGLSVDGDGGPVLERTSFEVLKKIITEKVVAYAAYNEVSNQIFLRNLQVYFARRGWPKDPQEGAQLKSYISQAITGFAADLYGGANALALKRGDRLVRERDVSQFAQQFIAHRINEYEDAIFFPNLDRERQVVIESYDMDSFRDSGLHWRYLQFALEDPSFKAQLGADPFAAELLAENIAQFGVLMLRIAGQHAIAQGDERLAPGHIEAGLRDIQERINAHQRAKPPTDGAHGIASTPSGPSGQNENNDSLWFSEVSAAMGIEYSHRSADWLNRQLRSYLKTGRSTGNITIPPAFGGSGLAAEDLNHDGWPDLLVLSGLGNRLYLNRSGKHFEDVTIAAGLSWSRIEDDTPGEPRQPIIADFDNDGHQDILVTYVNDDHRLYKGRGDGTFSDVTASCGLGGKGLVGGPATALDFDKDGKLDLFIAYFGDYVNGVLPTLARRNRNGLPDKLFRNLGGMRFEEVREAGVEDLGWGQAAGLGPPVMSPLRCRPMSTATWSTAAIRRLGGRGMPISSTSTMMVTTICMFSTE